MKYLSTAYIQFVLIIIQSEELEVKLESCNYSVNLYIHLETIVFKLKP